MPAPPEFTIAYSDLVSEVTSGLPNETKDLNRATENQAFFDHEGERYLERKEAEDEWDYGTLPKRSSGLLRQVVDALCDHLYNPGPNRNIDGDEGADQFVQKVYEQNHVNLKLRKADTLSTTNDVCAIQADPGDGVFDDRPLDLILWGREEFYAWVDPKNPCKPVAVVTIDRYDNRRRYRLWTPETVQEFATDKLTPDQTAGGVVSKAVTDRTAHDYGRIPFTFWHYDFPAQKFWTSGHGTYLRKCQMSIDTRLTRIYEAIDKHLCPIPVGYGVDAEWQPVIEPGRFMKMPFGANPLDGMGGAGQASQPRLEFLQAEIDIAGAWFDLDNFLKQSCESVGCPLSAVRMEQSGAVSGIAIIAEQAPLLTRAVKRQNIARYYEIELAKLCLEVAGGHYGKPALTTAAKTLKLNLSWPEPRIPIPGPERNADILFKMQEGFTSRTQELMALHGWTREQALAHFKQLAEDRADEERIDPTPQAPSEKVDDDKAKEAFDRQQEAEAEADEKAKIDDEE